MVLGQFKSTRIAQTCFGFSGRFWPTMRPLFQAGRSARMAGKFGVSMTDPPIRHALPQRQPDVDRSPHHITGCCAASERLIPWEAGTDNFDEALQLARFWFKQPETAKKAADPFPIGSKQDLNYCPWGNVFTVGHAMRDYVEWKRISATKSHFDSLVSRINYHILPRLGHLPLDQLTGRHIVEFSLDVLETPPKPGKQKAADRLPLGELAPDDLRKRKKTLNALIGILRLAVQLAWENGETDSERSWRCIRRVPLAETPRTIFLTREECTRLLICCRTDLREIVQGALYTGCRITELARLRVRDVAAHVFGLYIEPLKSRKPRYVFLPDEGMAFFLDLCADRSPDDLVFRRLSGQSWQNSHKHLFREAVLAAGLPAGFVFHGLRHTYASQLVQAGTPLIVVAQQLGHANTDTVSRTYGHLAPQIREVQVRTHFAALDQNFVERALRRKPELEALSRSLQGTDWRAYGQIAPTNSWPRSNFAISEPEVVQLLNDVERPN
jgi:integrase/recombinase XerD